MGSSAGAPSGSTRTAPVLQAALSSRGAAHEKKPQLINKNQQLMSFSDK
jgi:hypothetical protein